jgi:hypothetical protein
MVRSTDSQAKLIAYELPSTSEVALSMHARPATGHEAQDSYAKLQNLVRISSVINIAGVSYLSCYTLKILATYGLEIAVVRST